jgi:NADP-dependent 3-hydroxy acid dehydrogenase YdfG
MYERSLRKGPRGAACRREGSVRIVVPEVALSGQAVAVVTGASQGIGRAVAKCLSADGYIVWAVARRRAVLEKLAASRPGLIVAPCDLTDDAQVDRLATNINERSPRLAALVHCAGTYAAGRTASSPVADLREQFRANVEAGYLTTQRLLDMLVPGSTIVFLNSSQGIRASADVGQYAASMHARKAIADALRQELSESGVRVTSIYAGRTATPRQRQIYQQQGWAYQPDVLLQPDDIARMVLAILRLPDTAEVTDLSIRPAIKSY